METTTFAPEQRMPTFTPDAVPVPSLVIERLLRDRNAVWQQIHQEYRLHNLIRQMLVSSAMALFCYGLVIGASKSVWQALSSACKLPTLFLLTLAICLPTLYLFNLLYGGRLSVRQVLALGLSAITVISGLTLAFAPITLFFLITAQSYNFFVLLNVAIFTLTGIIGLQVLVDGTKAINRLAQASPSPAGGMSSSESVPGKPPAPAPATVHMKLIYIWLYLFAFVGTQLGWTLRPFFGWPGHPFMLFHPIEGNFYSEVVRLCFELLF